MAHQMARVAIAQGGRVLSVLEKVKLVCWFEETHSFAQVARRYRAVFGMEPPQMDQVKKLHRRFLNTGSILNATTATPPQPSKKMTTTTAFTGFDGGLESTAFPGLDDDGMVELEQTQQQMSVVIDAGALDAEEQLRMARM